MSDGALGSIEKGAATVARMLRRLIGPLDSADPSVGLKALVADLGWTLPDPVPPSLIGLRDPVATLTQDVDQLLSLVDSNGSDSSVAAAGAGVVAALARV